jgi:hypothetical protein
VSLSDPSRSFTFLFIALSLHQIARQGQVTLLRLHLDCSVGRPTTASALLQTAHGPGRSVTLVTQNLSHVRPFESVDPVSLRRKAKKWVLDVHTKCEGGCCLRNGSGGRYCGDGCGLRNGAPRCSRSPPRETHLCTRRNLLNAVPSPRLLFAARSISAPKPATRVLTTRPLTPRRPSNRWTRMAPRRVPT